MELRQLRYFVAVAEELHFRRAALLDEARRVLAQAEAAQLTARNARDHAGARLRIGYLPASVPGALQQLARGGLRVDASLESGTAVRLIEQVRDRRLDAVVTMLPAPTGGLTVTPVGRQGAVVAIAASAGGAPARARFAASRPALRLAA